MAFDSPSSGTASSVLVCIHRLDLALVLLVIMPTPGAPTHEWPAWTLSAFADSTSHSIRFQSCGLSFRLRVRRPSRCAVHQDSRLPFRPTPLPLPSCTHVQLPTPDACAAHASEGAQGLLPAVVRPRLPASRPPTQLRVPPSAESKSSVGLHPVHLRIAWGVEHGTMWTIRS
jgi:hypothetical protein